MDDIDISVSIFAILSFIYRITLNNVSDRLVEHGRNFFLKNIFLIVLSRIIINYLSKISLKAVDV